MGPYARNASGFRDRRRQDPEGHSPLACTRLMASRTCGGDRHALFSPPEVKDWVQRHTAPCLKRSRQENPSSPAVSGQTVWCSKTYLKIKNQPPYNPTNNSKTKKTKEDKSLLSPPVSSCHISLPSIFRKIVKRI